MIMILATILILNIKKMFYKNVFISEKFGKDLTFSSLNAERKKIKTSKRNLYKYLYKH